MIMYGVALALNAGIIVVLLCGPRAHAIGHPAAEIVGGVLGLCTGIIAIVALLPVKAPDRDPKVAADDAL